MGRKDGFTLIEMIIVVAIILIISSIAIPSTIGQIKKSNERKYYVEAKIIESAVEIYNLESSWNKIGEKESLDKVKDKLTNSKKRYITAWPSKLKCSIKGKEVEFDNESLNLYSMENLLEFLRKNESKYN